MDFFRLLLEMLKMLAAIHPPEKVCKELQLFRKTYQTLILRGVLFPDSYLYYENKFFVNESFSSKNM